jgi:hypothetical protein
VVIGQRHKKKHVVDAKLTSIGKVVVWIFPLVSIACVVFFFVSVKEGMDPKLVVADGSDFSQYLTMRESCFGHLGEAVDLAVFIDPAQQQAHHVRTLTDFLLLFAAVDSLASIESSATVSAANAFMASANATNSSLRRVYQREGFGTAIATFTQVAPQFTSDIIFNANSGKLEALRARFRYRYMADSTDRLRSMREVRERVDEANHDRDRDQTGPGGRFACFSHAHILWDSYPLVRVEATSSMVVSGAVVFLVLVLVMPLRVALLVLFVIACIDSIMLGWIPLLGMNLHSVTTICIVMSVGLAVDFSSHIAHAFQEAQGSRIQIRPPQSSRYLRASALAPARPS